MFKRAQVIQWAVVATALVFPAGQAWAQTGTAASPPDAVAEEPETSDWDFSVRPYLFLSGLSGSVTIPPLTFPINSSLEDLVDNLQLGGFISLAAQKRQWGVYADFQYISLIGKGEGAFSTEMQLDNIIGEVDATFRPGGASTLRFLVGVRVYSVEQTLSFAERPSVKATTTVIDPVLGAHGSWPLGRRWEFDMRGDIGGFGISSEFTYQLGMLFQWEASRSVRIPFGYRILGYQINAGDVWMNTRMSGVILGLDFRF